VTTAAQFTDPVAYHAEGPVWSTSWGGLRFVDLFAGDILSIHAGGAIGRRHVGTVAAALRPRTSGGAVIAVERGFVLEDSTGELHVLPEVWTDDTLRMNDGGCDPDGRFYCGTIAYDQAPGRANLYRLDADGTVSVEFGGSTISNGLGWSPDGSIAYYVYAKDTGLTGRRPFAVIPEGSGSPDGLTVDAEGCVWVALYGGSAVHRYRPDGALDGVVELPVSKVTACTFGGADLDQLFITTSREHLAEGDQPAAGSIFTIAPGVVGLPAAPFAG
jgi:sugar lactone lactonase YvrE